MLTTPGGATFSPCGTFRYTLTRRWRPGQTMLWILLNPSTATATADDPTIRRVTGFSRREQAGGFELLNIFALRSTDPQLLRSAPDPIGPDNDETIRKALRRHDTAVCAWGAFNVGGRDALLAEWAAELSCSLLCLGETASGAPRHPLYLRADVALRQFGVRQ